MLCCLQVLSSPVVLLADAVVMATCAKVRAERAVFGNGWGAVDGGVEGYRLEGEEALMAPC